MSKYCIYCRQELPAIATFCFSCGKSQNEKINEIPPTISPQKKSKNLNERLDELIEIFSCKQDIYDLRERSFVQSEKASAQKLLSIILLGIIISFVFYFGLYLVTDIDIGNVGFFLVLAICGVGLPIHVSIKKKSKIQAFQQQVLQANTELKKYYDDSGIKDLAFEYSNPYIIKKIKKKVTLGRAESMKEAINCLIDDEYKEKMLYGQQTQINAAKDAASAAEFAALFSLGIYLNTKK